MMRRITWAEAYENAEIGRFCAYPKYGQFCTEKPPEELCEPYALCDYCFSPSELKKVVGCETYIIKFGPSSDGARTDTVIQYFKEESCNLIEGEIASTFELQYRDRNSTEFNRSVFYPSNKKKYTDHILSLFGYQVVIPKPYRTIQLLQYTGPVDRFFRIFHKITGKHEFVNAAHCSIKGKSFDIITCGTVLEVNRFTSRKYEQRIFNIRLPGLDYLQIKTCKNPGYIQYYAEFCCEVQGQYHEWQTDDGDYFYLSQEILDSFSPRERAALLRV
jgi:hypothetical protein